MFCSEVVPIGTRLSIILSCSYDYMYSDFRINYYILLENDLALEIRMF